MNFLFKASVAAYLFLTASFLFGQETIKMKKEGGVYTIPCEVNGLKLRFIFDTGASDVSISSTEALFMLKNGYLDANDLLGSTEYQIANGDNIEGKKINLKRLKIGKRTLYNVKASIIYSSTAPLLLGQTAMTRFNNITLDYKRGSVYLGGSISNEDKGLTLANRKIDSLEREIKLKQILLDFYEKKGLKKQVNQSKKVNSEGNNINKKKEYNFIKCQDLYAEGKYSFCIECYSRLIDKDPNNYILYEERAIAKRKIYDYSGAFRDEQIAKRLERH